MSNQVQTTNPTKISSDQLFRQFMRVRKAQSNLVGAQILLREMATIAGEVSDVIFDAGRVYQLSTKPYSSGLFDVEIKYLSTAAEWDQNFRGDNG